MNAFIKLIFYAGFLFFGGGFIIAFCQFVAYNGAGDYFEYVKAEHFYISNDTTSMPAKLVYKYTVNGHEYKSSQNVSTETASSSDLSQFTIWFNTSFHKISIIKELKGRETKIWNQIVGMVIFGFFFLFIFLIYKFADMNKWIGIYTRGEYKRSKQNN